MYTHFKMSCVHDTNIQFSFVNYKFSFLLKSCRGFSRLQEDRIEMFRINPNLTSGQSYIRLSIAGTSRLKNGNLNKI